MKPFEPEKLPVKLDWNQFVHLIGKANAEVARFDGLLQSIPNPAVLLSPLTIQEAVLSSKIEGTQASVEEVLEYEADPKMKTEKFGDIQEVLNYREALAFAVREMKKLPLSLRLIRGMHRILLSGVRGQNKNPGNFRSTQNWIGPIGSKIENASFVPPSPEKIMDCLSNLEKYIHSAEKDFVVQLAIVHAQFEMIHPFNDGNGRLGRILVPLFLYDKKVLSSPVFYLSQYLEAERANYYRNLRSVSQNHDWEGWIEYFLTAVIEQAKVNIQKAKAIHQLYDLKKIKIEELTRSRFAIKALDFLFCFPYFTTSQFVKESGIPRMSSIRIIEKLVDGGVLQRIQKGSGHRPSAYIFKKLLEIVG